MTLLTAQIVLKTKDALPENFVTNTIHIDSHDLEITPGSATSAIADFYSAVRGGLGSSIATVGHEVKWYVTDQPRPNYPFETIAFVLSGPSGTTQQPAEVALCVSYQAQKENGVTQSSRRGRIYLGPLSTPVNEEGRPQTSFRQGVAEAFQQLIFDIKAISGPAGVDDFVIYSPTNGTFASFDNGWIDNAFDTQRRRGLAPSSRITWGLGGLPS
uniref:Uncharacterized protein n=1 Tax=uncultured prokaryote TaxID=198431 RepID=A0A0H5Q8I2_9ZZZZ|nr:hypothetical protein [uncultured prokaryote]